MRHRYYVGLVVGKRGMVRSLFTSDREPTEITHGKIYGAVIGPFRTRRGAAFMARYGANNPHCQTVTDAERLAKR